VRSGVVGAEVQPGAQERPDVLLRGGPAEAHRAHVPVRRQGGLAERMIPLSACAPVRLVHSSSFETAPSCEYNIVV